MFRKMLLFHVILFYGICAGLCSNTILDTLTYKVDLTNLEDDLFHVEVNCTNLTPDNEIFSFIAIVPGTYRISDFGNFVTSFEAFDINNSKLKVNRINTNQWRIEDPEKVSKIVYTIEDTYDAKIQEDAISSSGGTLIHDDLVILNPFGVFGFFNGMRSNPVKIQLNYKNDWVVGTSLKKGKNGYYNGSSYDQLIDSPILIGDLTQSSLKHNNLDVSIYVYSTNSEVDANSVLEIVKGVISSAGDFLTDFPVTYYTFLFVLPDLKTASEFGLSSQGALEHSNNSLYYLLTETGIPSNLNKTIAHEFTHIVTPLSVHSDKMYPVDYMKPAASKHLWLYEGVVEWASDIMLLRNNIIDLDNYLGEISRKMGVKESLGEIESLKDESLNIFDKDSRRILQIFYSRGALTALCLDIELLTQSNGKWGLRELLLKLNKQYSSDNPFPEDDFFKILVELTYPEIQDFINDYIIGDKELPFIEYLNKVGIKYFSESVSEQPVFSFSIFYNSDGEYLVRRLNIDGKNAGLKEDDQIISLFGIELKKENLDQIFKLRNNMKVGDQYEIVIIRGKRKKVLTQILYAKVNHHVLNEMENISESQSYLKQAWIHNNSLFSGQ